MGSLTGKTIGGFLIEQELGRGAMGVVFKASQLSMDRPVALKFLPKRLAQEERTVARFLREARAAGQLSHPNVVGVHDAGVIDGLHFIAMEFVDGTTVHKRLREKGPYSETDALAIAQQIAEALKYAHGRGILHRDIKPDNFLIDTQQHVKLADLGLARFTSGDHSKDAELTQDGMALGTPHYMSPEQCKGEAVDTRSDLYSLGASLFVMVSGQTPYDAATAAAVMVKVLTEPPKSLRKLQPGLSPGFVAMVEKMMARNPAQRFQNAQEILEAIERVRRGTYKVTALCVPPGRPALKTLSKAPRYKLVMYGAGAALLTLVVLGILSERERREREHQQSLAEQAFTEEKRANEIATQGNAGANDAIVAAMGTVPTKGEKGPPVDGPKQPESRGAPPPPPGEEPELSRPELQGGKRLWRQLRGEMDSGLERNPRAGIKKLEEFERTHPAFKELVAAWKTRAREMDARLQSRWDALNAEAQREAASGRTAKAIRMYGGFILQYEDTEQGRTAAKALADLLKSTREEAERLAKNGNLDRAEHLLADLPKLPRELAAPIDAALATIRAEQQRNRVAQQSERERLKAIHERAEALAQQADSSGQRYKFGEAADLLRGEATKFATRAVRREAEALMDVYVRAAAVFQRMKTAFDAAQSVPLESLGAFKSPGTVVSWSERGLEYKTGELQPQAVTWKNVAPEQLLKIAEALKITGGLSSSELCDAGTLAFAAGANNVAADLLEKAAGSDSSLRALVDAPLRLLGRALPDRNELARKLFEEAQAAYVRKEYGPARSILEHLVVDYAETPFVQARSAEIAELSAPPAVAETGGAPVRKEEKEPGKAAPEQSDAALRALAVTELKKMGWATVSGGWEPDPQARGAFVVKNGGRLTAEASDVALQVAFVLEEGAELAVYARHDGNTPAAKLVRERGAAFEIDVGEGYGFKAAGGLCKLYGDRTNGSINSETTRGSFERQAVPVKLATVMAPSRTLVTVNLSVRENDLVIQCGERTIRSKEDLRKTGGVVLTVTGDARVAQPVLKALTQ